MDGVLQSQLHPAELTPGHNLQNPSLLALLYASPKTRSHPACGTSSVIASGRGCDAVRVTFRELRRKISC